MTAGSDLSGLLRRGLAVFPLPPGSKEAAPGWHRRCTTGHAAAAGWPAGSNTGVGCRASSIVGLDLDRHAGKPDGVASFACLCGEHGAGWPSTFTVATPCAVATVSVDGQGRRARAHSAAPARRRPCQR